MRLYRNVICFFSNKLNWSSSFKTFSLHKSKHSVSIFIDLLIFVCFIFNSEIEVTAMENITYCDGISY